MREKTEDIDENMYSNISTVLDQLLN